MDELEAAGHDFCDDQFFTSTTMRFGDAALFYGDVRHYGPANASVWQNRDVLFVMIRPPGGPDDSEQSFHVCQ